MREIILGGLALFWVMVLGALDVISAHAMSRLAIVTLVLISAALVLKAFALLMRPPLVLKTAYPEHAGTDHGANAGSSPS